jgi:hypothetical protein
MTARSSSSKLMAQPQFWIKMLCDAVFGAFTSLWRLPVDILVWNLDVASLAMDTAGFAVSSVFEGDSFRLTFVS